MIRSKLGIFIFMKQIKPKSSKIFRYCRALLLSFYSKRLYLEVARNWRGSGLAYCLFVIMLAGLPFSLKTMVRFNQFYNQQLIAPFKKMPTLAIQNGQLHFDYFMPFLIKNNQGKVVIVIDAAGQLTKVNYIYPHWIMLVTEDNLYFRMPTFSILSEPSTAERSYETIKFKDIDSDSFNATEWIKNMHIIGQKWLFLVMIYPLFSAVLFGFFCGLIALMSVIGKLLAHTIFKLPLGFKETYRMMSVSSGCGVSVFILGLNFFGRIPFMGTFLMIAMSFYFSYAMLAIKRDYRRLVVQS